MNKKIVEKEPKKKKRNRCCSCLISSLVVVLVITIGGLTAAWFVGDHMTTKYFDMKMSESFDVLQSLYWASEKNNVDNPYEDSDVDAFYSELKKSLFLKEDVVLNADTVWDLVSDKPSAQAKLLEIALLESGVAPDGTGGTDNPDANPDGTGGTDNPDANPDGTGGTDNPDANPDGTGGTDSPDGEVTPEEGDSKLMNFFSSIIKRENIDLERLAAYEQANHADYVLKINDKQLAAFANQLIGKIIGDTGLGQSLEGFGITDLDKVISLKQIVFDRRTHQVPIVSDVEAKLLRNAATDGTNPDGTDTPDANPDGTGGTDTPDANPDGTEGGGQVGTEAKEITTVKLTIRIGAEDAAIQFLSQVKQLNGWRWATDFLVRLILPKNIYATVEVGLDYNVGIDIDINKFDDTTKARTFKLVKGITKLTGNEIDVQQKANQLVTDTVQSYLDSAAQYLEFSSAKDGSIPADPFNAVLSLTGNADKEESQQIAPSEIVMTLKGLLTSDMDKAIEVDSTYKGYHWVEGIPVYKPHDDNAETAVDYKEEFMKEMRVKYVLGDDVLYDDLIALFGIGTSSTTKDLMDMLNTKRLQEALGVEDLTKLRVHITDRMLGAIISSQLDSMVGEGSSILSHGVDVEQVIVSTGAVENCAHCTGFNPHWFLNLGISIQTDNLLPKDNALTGLVADLLPNRIMVSIKVDVTNIDETVTEFIRGETVIRYNDFKDTDIIFDVVEKLGAGAVFSKDELSAQIVAPIRDMIKKMCETLPMLSFSESEIVMPDLFTTISDMLFKDDNGDKVVTGEEIKDVLSGVDESSDDAAYEAAHLDATKKPLDPDSVTAEEEKAKAGYNQFMSNVKRDYYILDELNEVDSFDKLFNKIDVGAGFSLDNFRITGDNGLVYDPNPVADLKPFMKDSELGWLFIEKLKAPDSGFSEDLINILEVKIEMVDKTDALGEVMVDSEGNALQVATLNIVIKIDVKKMLEGKNSAILTADYLYINASVLIDEDKVVGAEGNKSYPTTINVNNMSEVQLNNLKKIIDHLNKDSASAMFDFDARALEVGKVVYDQLNTLNASLNGDAHSGGFEFKEGGIEFISFYEFLGRALKVDSDAEVIKAAIQGLYAEQTNSSAYNYNASEILYNAFDPLAAMPEAKLQYSDLEFGRFLYGDGTTSMNDLVQTVFLTSSTTGETSKKTAAIKWITDFGASYDTAHDHIVMTFLIGKDEIGTINTANAGYALLPDNVYVTLVFENGGAGTGFAYKWFRINNMTQAEQLTLFDLAGVEDNKMQDKANKTIDVLKAYNNASFSNSSETDTSVGIINII